MEVSVNGVEIPAAVFAAECQNHPAADADTVWDEAARSLIIRELLLQEARRLGLVAEPMTDDAGRMETVEDALINRLLDDQIKTPKAEDADCRRYHENNPKRFCSPDVFEASHILLSADRDDNAAFATAVSEAEAIIQVLEKRPQDFADFARQRSDCPSGSEGGRLGQITRGQTTPEFETFLLALDEGQLCTQAVKTPYGVHILRLDRKVSGRVLPFDTVRDRIATYIEESSWRRAVSQYIRILAGRATILGADLEGANGELVR